VLGSRSLEPQRNTDTMTLVAPQQCAYRVTGIGHEHSSITWCRLLQELANVSDLRTCEVSDAMCAACCRTFPPARDDINPVIAALLYDLSARIIARGGHAGCSVEQARRNLQIAEESLPLVQNPPDQPLRLRRAPPRGNGGCRIGLVGCNTATGLGYLNRDIAAHMGIDRWLDVEDSTRPALPPVAPPDKWVASPAEMERVMPDFLHGLDWVMFCETPLCSALPRMARQMGVQSACVPMWEWLSPGLSWIGDVDLMLCPTRHCFHVVRAWKFRYGFRWQIQYVRWPVDTQRFPYRQRLRCERFLFIHGHGGMPGTGTEKPRAIPGRKGLDVVVATAALVPHIQFLVRTQCPEMPRMPANVEILPEVENPSELYATGDCCIQPSYWEGLGLPLLESQACGLPLITTNAAPMNEAHPFRVVPCDPLAVEIAPRHKITAHAADPRALAGILTDIYETDISVASFRARQHVERSHSWDAAIRGIHRAFNPEPSARP
jgi:hypothetical protein